MKLKIIALFLLLFTQSVTAIADRPDFMLDDAELPWGMQITPLKDSPIKLRLGARLQTAIAFSSKTDTNTGEDSQFHDFYIRRGRFQFEAKYQDGIKFYMDVRNDDAGKNDKGEGDFNIGDAYVQVKNVFDIKGLNFRAFRAKVDVARTETISSSKILFLDRPKIADEAAQYVSHNRRAANVQLQGTFDKWYFQVVAGDGVQKGKFHDARGNKLGGGIDSQNFMVGAKVKIYPFEGWADKKPTETYFGKGKHISLGVGGFYTGGIKYSTGGAQQDKVSRGLVNGEFSFHYKNLSFQSEYFHFSDVIEDFNAATKVSGESDGYYAQIEYLFPHLGYTSIFTRFESWDKFKQKDDYDLTTTVVGVNWYLRAKKTRLGLVYQKDELDSNLRAATQTNRGEIFEEEQTLKLTSMWHF